MKTNFEDERKLLDNIIILFQEVTFKTSLTYKQIWKSMAHIMMKTV